MYTTLKINGTFKHVKYEQTWLKSLSVMLNTKVFAMQDGQQASRLSYQSAVQTGLVTYICMLLIWKLQIRERSCKNQGESLHHTHNILLKQNAKHETKVSLNTAPMYFFS